MKVGVLFKRLGTDIVEIRADFSPEKIMKEKSIFEVDNYLSGNMFTKCEGYTSWVRKTNEVTHYISLELTKGKHIRVVNLAFLNSLDSKVLGGNLTQSSISGSETVGGDYYWDENNPDEIESLIHSLKVVSIPWFLTVSSENKFLEVSQHANDYLLFNIPSEVTSNVIEQLETTELNHKKYEVLDYNVFLSEFVPLVVGGLKKYGFDIVSDGVPFIIRQKEGLMDVIMLELINYGSHVGAYAYNWTPELAIDGSDMVTRDNSFFLNGGVISKEGVGENSGEAFIVAKDLEEGSAVIVERIKAVAFPLFDKVQDKDSFVSTIKSDMLNMAQSLLKL